MALKAAILTSLLCFNRPMYIGSREEDHTEFAYELQEHLEDLLYVCCHDSHVPTPVIIFDIPLQAYNVDIAMWAHVHCYQRTCPVYQGECVSGAPIHVVIGMGGRDLADGAKP